jgi:hypothetical protein
MHSKARQVALTKCCIMQRCSTPTRHYAPPPPPPLQCDITRLTVCKCAISFFPSLLLRARDGRLSRRVALSGGPAKTITVFTVMFFHCPAMISCSDMVQLIFKAHILCQGKQLLTTTGDWQHLSPVRVALRSDVSGPIIPRSNFNYDTC